MVNITHPGTKEEKGIVVSISVLLFLKHFIRQQRTGLTFLESSLLIY